MIRFHEFLKENKLDKINTIKLSYDEFLSSIIDSCQKDFKMTKRQSIEFTILYKDKLKLAWENEFSTREAIASTKISGVIFDDKLKESFIYDIDTLYESYIDKINSEKTYENIIAYVNDYYNYFNYEKFSDKRIFERVKNNFKSLNKLADKRIFEMNYDTKEGSIEVDVDERNDKLIDEIIDKFSFVYKKKKDRYLRPIKITGKTLYNDIKLEITLSNKDLISILYKEINEDSEIKIYINGILKYHMDNFDIEDISSKMLQIYSSYLNTQNFHKISIKNDPFE
jgi:hypothetical protein